MLNSIKGGTTKMGALQNAEKSLEGVFKDLPKLPDSSKEALAKFWPWLALIAGIVQILAALALWRLLSWADRFTDGVSEFSRLYTGVAVGPSSFEKTIIYLGVLILIVDALILLMAYPHLKRRAKQGWDLLFLGALINAVYSVLQVFTYQRGLGDFIFGLIGSAFGFYLLFQVKEKFNSKSTGSAPSSTT